MKYPCGKPLNKAEIKFVEECAKDPELYKKALEYLKDPKTFEKKVNNSAKVKNNQ